MRQALRVVCCSTFIFVGFASQAAPQSVLDRSPNVSGAWVPPHGTLQFNFLHRFTATGAPARKVSSSPTFLLGLGLPRRLMLGLHYATSSEVAPRSPNEWEFFGRFAPLSEEAGAPASVSLQAGYNQAAESVDGELAAARRFGPLRLLAALRALGSAYAAGETRFALAGGATVRLHRWVALAGDVASLLDREEAAGEELAWGAGLQLAIPYTPHTLSLQATNANTGTLQGLSRGADQVRYGFEFTIPITLRRYFGGPVAQVDTVPPPLVPERPVLEPVPELPPPGEKPPLLGPDTTPAQPPPAAAPPVAAPAPARAPEQPPTTVNAGMRELAFTPARLEVPAGTTIVWRNRDAVVHTVTADNGSWDSGGIEPGATWRRRFDRPGTYRFHCTPHPFMKGVVVVRSR